MNTRFTESTIKDAAIEWLEDLGYVYVFDPDIAFDGFISRLARLRDGLSLPRLMRGEARVKDKREWQNETL